MAIEEGKKAPAFTLPDENDDKIKLADPVSYTHLPLPTNREV